MRRSTLGCLLAAASLWVCESAQAQKLPANLAGAIQTAFKTLHCRLSPLRTNFRVRMVRGSGQEQVSLDQGALVLVFKAGDKPAGPNGDALAEGTCSLAAAPLSVNGHPEEIGLIVDFSMTSGATHVQVGGVAVAKIDKAVLEADGPEQLIFVQTARGKVFSAKVDLYRPAQKSGNAMADKLKASLENAARRVLGIPEVAYRLYAPPPIIKRPGLQMLKRE